MFRSTGYWRDTGRIRMVVRIQNQSQFNGPAVGFDIETTPLVDDGRRRITRYHQLVSWLRTMRISTRWEGLYR